VTPSQFADFWRIQGHRVIETASCFWYNAQLLSFLSLPYHRTIWPAASELGQVFRRGPAAVVRFFIDDPGQGDQGLFVRTERDYDFSSLEKKARNQTRRGLEKCAVEQLDFAYVAREGHAINTDTFVRQGRAANTFTETQWHRYCQAAAATPDLEAWGAFVEGQLAAFMVTALVEDCYNILHQASRTSTLASYPNNALTFTVTSRELSRTEVGFISYGLKSLEDTSSLDHFKLQMGYRLQPRSDRVVLNALLKPFTRLGGRRLVHWMAQRPNSSDFWRKASRVLLKQ